MNYLVTGGAGFIGSNLAQRLLLENHRVFIVDDFSTGVISNIPKGSEFIPIHMLDSLKGIWLDGVYHLGMASSSPMYKQNHRLVGDTVNWTLQVLDLCRETGARLVYASTSSLYNGCPTPMREDMNIQPTDYYTEARYTVERLAELYYKLHQVQSIGLRLFSVYGPGEQHKKQYANLISQFTWSIQRGEHPVIYGGGSQTRDFTYVDDVVEAFTRAMQSNIEHTTLNVGTGVSLTLNETVDIINNALDTNIPPLHIPNPIKNYVQDTRADTTRLQKTLGYTPQTTPQQGIQKLLNTTRVK